MRCSRRRAALSRTGLSERERLRELAGHGLKESDCAELSLTDEQRDAILDWAKSKPPLGKLSVYCVALGREALYHPLIGTTENNLPRDLRQLLHESAEDGQNIGDQSELKIEVKFNGPDGKQVEDEDARGGERGGCLLDGMHGYVVRGHILIRSLTRALSVARGRGPARSP